jgi:hypothetical protein
MAYVLQTQPRIRASFQHQTSHLRHQSRGKSASYIDSTLHIMAEDIYSELRPERQEIRLMFLEAGEPQEELKASLMVTSLRWAAEYWNPEFEALSYVWGDPLITRPIELNGQPFQVTENLEAALRRLRHNDRVRIMWIDAICINQRNPREQEHQIGLMRDVFEGCSQCIVWLGEEDDETEKALEPLHWMSHNLHVDQWPCFEVAGDDGVLKSFEWSTSGIESVMEPLHRFLSRPWFTRTWTFQEFVLPRMHEIRCGHFHIFFEILHNSQQNFNSHLATCCRHRAHTDALRYVSRQLDSQILPLAKTRELPQNAEGFDFLTALEDNCHRIATKDHDKVYGLLGLAPPVFQKFIVPDYRLDIPMVYAQPLVTYWQTNPSLRPLLSSTNRNSNFNLPSWAPDWSSASNYMLRLWRRRYSLYDACGQHRLYPNIYDYKVLHVQGFKCDTVKTTWKIIDPALGKFRDLRTYITVAIKSWLNMAMSPYETQSPITKVSREKAFWRTIIFDSRKSQHGCPMHRATECDYDALRDHFINSQPSTPYIQRLVSDFKHSIVGFLFAVTNHGSLTMVPSDTKMGDEIYILAGGNMPFVLRPSEATFSLPGSAGVQHSCHTLVGECYLDEAMDGQLADKLRDEATDIFIV